MSKYGHLTGNWYEALVNKMGGEARANAFVRDELILVPRNTIKIWDGDPFEVTLGGNCSIDFSSHLLGLGTSVANSAKKMLGMKSFMATEKTEEQQISVVVIDVGILGFGGSSPLRSEVYRRAFGFGLDICPVETAPRFLMQFSKKLKCGEWFFFASEPIPGEDDDASLFMVGCHSHNEPYLTGYSIRDSILPNNARLAFQIRK